MSQKSDALLQKKIDQLKMDIIKLGDPEGIAFRCGMEFKAGNNSIGLFFSLFDTPVTVLFPELKLFNSKNNNTLSTAFEAMICYHMATADGSCLTGKWISFAELPDGRFYNQAFQGYTGDKLSALLGNDVESFSSAALSLNGVLLPIGDASFEFKALPKVPLAVVYWKGDEEFPPSCKVLFDASASHYLPTDACAILGSLLIQKIKNHLEEKSGLN